HAPSRPQPVRAQPRRAAHLPEGAAPLVEEQARAALPRPDDVHPAVVVDVADRDAHAVTADVQPGALADIDEAAALGLAEEAVGRARAGAGVLGEGKGRAGGLVAVEGSGAGAPDLGHEILSGG